MPEAKAIVTVAMGGNRHHPGTLFSDRLERWRTGFGRYGEGTHLEAFTELPPGSPEHTDVPYAFKAYAMQAMLRKGFTSVLWADSATVAVRSLAPLWEQVEGEGYWLADNFCWNCGEWTCDAALPLLGIGREEAFSIPQVAASAFALDFRNSLAIAFFSGLMRYARNGAFRGPWTNEQGQASPDLRVQGHRHDQTAASVMAWRLGMRLTPQPHVFSDNHGDSPTTILRLER
jgi:hypothetical protein